MKIALFGGSFDPPHAGHDAAARAILSSLKPDLLVIMPSFLNPFKKSFSAPPQLRLRWCRALWSGTPHVEVSDYEISQNYPVPTIQSVKFLLEKYGGNGKIAAETATAASKTQSADTAPKLYIVVGADNLSELHKWRDFSELQKLAEFVVLTRPGYEIPRQWADLRRIEIAVDASSSGFRRDFKGEIPPKIAAEVIKFYKRKDMQDPKQRAERIAEILNEKKAEDVQIIDMEGREYIAKFVVIATMLTARHAASLIEELKSVLKPLGEEFLAIESGDEWSVVDLGDIIVHLISEAHRAKYNIEDFLDKLKKEQF